MAEAPVAAQSTEASALLTERLDHLSRKAGVVATIVLDRLTGNVLQKTSGSASKSPFIESQLSHTPKDETASSPAQKDADEFATMVWKFVSSAGGLVTDLDAEDEIKLLRLRTKKSELVIVPDAKYILIVVHETSAARSGGQNPLMDTIV